MVHGVRDTKMGSKSCAARHFDSNNEVLSTGTTYSTNVIRCISIKRIGGVMSYHVVYDAYVECIRCRDI